MTGGWRNPLMQNENDFIALDGAMVSIAAAAQTLFHPGFGFPQMVPSQMPQYAGAEMKSVSSLDQEDLGGSRV